MSFDPEFEEFRSVQLENQRNNSNFTKLTSDWVKASVETRYSYGFNWLGVPIIQFPTDLVAFQEIVYKTKPTLIIECGVARGGSAIFWASIQRICGIESNVIGVDIDIRPHARAAIEGSSFKEGIRLIQGSSIDMSIAGQVRSLIRASDKVMVVLDSNHTHEHVLEELKLYADLVSVDAYLLVLDTVIENLPIDESRPWGPGANPQTAVLDFMKNRSDFENDSSTEDQISITVAPKGYWKRISKP
jgi:cephalosporin hydroxylase